MRAKFRVNTHEYTYALMLVIEFTVNKDLKPARFPRVTPAQASYKVRLVCRYDDHRPFMDLILKTNNLPDRFYGAVLAIGNFDGVHRGHLQVLDKAREIAKAADAPFGALTFEPHPRRLLRPNAPHFCLTPLKLKARLMEMLGLDVLIAARFDEALARLSASEFVAHILGGDLKARHVVTGRNFYFGAGREGDFELLEKLGTEHAINVSAIELASQAGEGAPVFFSSSAVRKKLQEGAPRAAADLLGHWWQISGRVSEGDKRGREIGFPTANIILEKDTAPKFGVYAVRVRTMKNNAGKIMSGVANLGVRPTFAVKDPVLEVHVLDFNGDLYGQELLVELISFIRPEIKFSGLNELKTQIARDVQQARDELEILQTDGDPMQAYPIGKAMAPKAE